MRICRSAKKTPLQSDPITGCRDDYIRIEGAHMPAELFTVRYFFGRTAYVVRDGAAPWMAFPIRSWVRA